VSDLLTGRRARVRTTRATLALAAVVGVACADGALVPAPPRSYGLVTIGGAALPVVVDASTTEITYVLAGDIRLDQSGTVVRTTLVQRVRPGELLPLAFVADTTRYTQTGDHILVDLFCGAGAACPQGGEGTVTEDRLTLTPSVTPSVRPSPLAWAYERLRPID